MKLNTKIQAHSPQFFNTFQFCILCSTHNHIFCNNSFHFIQTKGLVFFHILHHTSQPINFKLKITENVYSYILKYGLFSCRQLSLRFNKKQNILSMDHLHPISLWKIYSLFHFYSIDQSISTHLFYILLIVTLDDFNDLLHSFNTFH